MKAITEKKLMATIRKEFKAGREWNRRDWGHYYKMMIDVDDAEIWSDCFISGNNWKVYKLDTVKYLEFNEYATTVPEIEKAYLGAAIELLEANGWTVERNPAASK